MIHNSFQISPASSSHIGVGRSSAGVVFANVVAVIGPGIFQVDQKHVVVLYVSNCFHYVLLLDDWGDVKTTFDQDGS